MSEVTALDHELFGWEEAHKTRKNVLNKQQTKLLVEARHKEWKEK